MRYVVLCSTFSSWSNSPKMGCLKHLFKWQCQCCSPLSHSTHHPVQWWCCSSSRQWHGETCSSKCEWSHTTCGSRKCSLPYPTIHPMELTTPYHTHPKDRVLKRPKHWDGHLLDNVYHTDGSPTKHYQIWHPTHLPAFWWDRAYTSTTRWKMHRCCFCRGTWHQMYFACVCWWATMHMWAGDPIFWKHTTTKGGGMEEMIWCLVAWIQYCIMDHMDWAWSWGRSDIHVQLPLVHDTRGTVGGTGTTWKVQATGDVYISCFLHFLKQLD